MNGTDDGRMNGESGSWISSLVFALFCVTLVLGEGNVALMIGLCVKRLFDPIRTALVISLTFSNALLINSSILAMVVMKKRTWIFGSAACTLYWMTEQSNKYASIFSLTALCIDNFIIVRYAFRSKEIRTAKYAVCALCLIWIPSLLLLTPVVLYTEALDYHVATICVMVWPRSSPNATIGNVEAAYVHTSVSVAYVAPLLLMLVLYPLTLRKLSQQSQCRNQNYRATTILIISLTAIYFCCWTPYWVLNYLANVYRGTNNAGVPLQIAIRLMTMLPYINSAVYPYTYLLLPRNRRAIFGRFAGHMALTERNGTYAGGTSLSQCPRSASRLSQAMFNDHFPEQHARGSANAEHDEHAMLMGSMRRDGTRVGLETRRGFQETRMLRKSETVIFLNLKLNRVRNISV